MPTPTLDAYRAANPADTRSDAELIPSLVGQLQHEGTLERFPDLVQANEQLNAGPAVPGPGPIGGEFLKGIGSGTQSAEAKMYSTAALLGGLTKNQGLKEWGIEGYNQHMRNAATFGPSVTSMSQIHSPSDAARYAAGFAGGFVPQGVGIAGATAIGAGLGSLAGPEGTIAGGLAGLGEGLGLGVYEGGALAVGETASAMGGTLGAGAAMASQSQDYGELVNQGARSPEAVALGVGALGGVLQAYVPAVVLHKIFGNTAGEAASAAVNSVLNKAETALPGLGTYMAKDMAKQAGTMAVANTSTELATMIGEEYANRDNPNYTPLTGSQIKQRLLEAGASGALLGAGFGAVEGFSTKGVDKAKLKDYMAAENTRQANTAATHAAMMDAAGFATPQQSGWEGERPEPVASTPEEPLQAQAPLETSPIEAPIGTPPSAAFTTVEDPEPTIAGPAPVQHEPYDPRVELAKRLAPIDPELAKRAEKGDVTPEEVSAALNPPAPPEPPKPVEEPGAPVALEPAPPPEKPKAPVEFAGWQETGGYPSHVEQWHLKEDIPGHPAGSTVGRPTLESAGFDVPKAPDMPAVAPAPTPVSKDALPGNAANWLPPAAEPVEREFKFVKSPDFATNGEYNIQTRDGVVTVYKDPEDKGWYDVHDRGPLHGKPTPLGATKEDVVAVLKKAGHIASERGPTDISLGARDGQVVKTNYKPVQAPKPLAESEETPPPVFSTKPIQDVLPELRVPATHLNPGSGYDEIAKSAKVDLRENESAPNTSKKLLAVYDRETGTTKLLPLFRSTANKWRVALSLENPDEIIRKISNELGIKKEFIIRDLEAQTPRGELIRAMFGDEAARTQKDPFVDELLAKLSTKGEQRYLPTATLDTMEAIQRRVFEFKDRDLFLKKMEEQQARLIPKSAVGGRAAPDATMEKLRQISPEHARLAQILASLIESDREKIDALKKMGDADATRGILKVPHISEVSEKLGAATKATDLIRKFGPTKNSPAKWMGLFDDDMLEAATTIAKNPKLLDGIAGLEGKNPQEKFKFLLRDLADKAGFKTWPNYLVKASRLLKNKDTGEPLDEETLGRMDEEGESGKESAEQENLEGIEGTGTGSTKTLKGWNNTTAAFERAVSNVKIFNPKEGEAQLGGMSLDEMARLQHALISGVMDATGEDEEPGLDHNTGADILAARADSDMEGVTEDDEFNDMKAELRDFITHVFETSRGKDSSMMTDEQLYKVWAQLDRAARNTMPAKDDYRETNTEISARYRGTVSTLLGLGVDVNLIEQSLDAQSHLLSQEMEQVHLPIGFGDGRRILIQTMEDINNPSMENLRTTLHGAAHILFHNESASVRALLLDAVDRMTNLKLDVFSKTRDARIREGSSELSGSLLAEEVLAEHMSYFGLKQKYARGLAGQFIGALKQIYLRGAILWAQLRGYALDPKIAQDYMESRMTEFVDKTLNSTKDLDVLTGNVVNTPDRLATMYKPIEGAYQKSEYDPMTGNTIIKDVIPTGRMETLFNLDNHTQFHDYVVRNTKTDKPTIDYFRERYGISEKPSQVSDMLDKIQEAHADSPVGAGGELRFLLEGIRQNIPNFLKENTVRFASTDEDFARLELKKAGKEYQSYNGDRDMDDPHSAGLYSPNRNEILINPYQETKYNSLGAANLLLHEVMHIGTVHALTMHEQFRTLGSDIEALHVMYPDMPQASLSSILHKTTKLEGIYEHLKGLKGDETFYPGAYGMLNLHEFASEVMTNNMFQRKLGEVTLPDKLAGAGRLKSAWDTVVHLVTSLWTRPPNEKNAYIASVRAVEGIMRTADAHHFAPTDDVIEPRAPMTQAQSDDLVRKDFEYHYAEHNSWTDLINDKVAPLARASGVSTTDYLQRVFGVTDPLDARKALDETLAARPQELVGLNKDQRLGNAKGGQNQLQAGSVRDSIVRSILSRAQNAMIRLDEIHADMTRRIPRFEAALEERAQKFSQWDTKLNDVMNIRDDIVKALKVQIGTLNRSLRDATFWSTEHHGLAGVAADMFGIKGGYGMPSDLVKHVVDSAIEAGHSDKITGLLAYFSQKGMNVAGLTPSEIENNLIHLSHVDPDERLAPFTDGSPKAKTDLAVAIWAAKTSPENSMLLGIRSETDLAFKQLMVAELKNASRKATQAAAPLPDMMRLSDQRKARVVSIRQTVSKYRGMLEQAKADLDNAALVAKESEKARAAMQSGIGDMQREHNIQAGSFYPSHGAAILLTPDPRGGTVKGTLSLLPKDQNQLIQHIFDNHKWLDQNQGVGGPEYAAVKSQFQALKAVAGGYFQSNVQKSWYAKIFESMGTRLRYTGNPTAKMAADMIDRYVNVDRSAEKLTFIGRDVTKAFGEAQRSFGFDKNYDGFIRSVFTPTCHFLEHFDTKAGEDGAVQAKAALKTFLAGKADTGKWMREHPEAFDSLWAFYNKNLEANHGVRDLAASDVNKNPVLVKDPSLPIKDPFTGNVGPSFRRALDTGYGTTQRDLQPLFEFKRTLDSIKDSTGNSVWKTIPKDAPIDPAMEKALFTPDVVDKFVRPYMDDVSTLHFPAPRGEDGESYGKANPASVQQAWNESGGNLRKFSQGLYARDTPLKPSAGGADEYHQDVLRFFQGQYKKIANLTEGQEDFEKRGFGPNFISSNMMDTRKAEDFPPEFTKYRIYDHISLQQMVNNIAAHGTMGRDLGLFDGSNDRNHGIVWMLHQAKQEMQADHNTLLTARSTVLMKDPRTPAEEVEKQIKAQFGEKEYKRLTNLPDAMREIDAVEKNLWGALTAANGSSRAFSAGATTLQTMVEFMLNNFRSVLTKSNSLIAPMQVYGAGKVGRTQVIRSFMGSGRNVMGSFVQALAGDARMATAYDKAVHNSGVGLDRANFMTPATIIADSGKNNAYETQKYLGNVRKLRDIFFNTGFKPPSAEERIAPALRPQAPYAMLSESMDLGIASSEAQYYNDVFKAALQHYKDNPQDANDPAFRFTKEKLNANMPMPLSDANMTRLHYQMQTMGSTLELETRELHQQEGRGADLGDVVVPKHLMPLIVSQGLSDIALESDINKGPAWMYNTKFGRFGMFLMKWATIQMNQVVGMAKTRDGEANWQHGKAMAITMAAGIIPASMCISMLIDEYDERVLGKKSNAIGFNFDSPSQTAAALMERTSRIGTFGLLGDVANGLRVYGSDGDTRGISFDQRVVFMNTLMSTLSLVNTAVHQEGHLTYDTFWRPLLNTVGGNSILQYGQIMNQMAVNMGGQPVLQSEWEQTRKINALNYLRGAGRINDIPIRQGGGEGYTPTPMHPYMSAMVLAAYANNAGGFQDAYRDAVDEAKREGEDDPEEVVKRSFAAYQPLKYVYQAMPTTGQISRIMMSLSDKGREDVSSAIQSYDHFAALIGIKSNMSASKPKPKASPKAF